MIEYVKNRWVEALTSGRYKQGFNYLREDIDGKSHFDVFGVLYDVIDPNHWEKVGGHATHFFYKSDKITGMPGLDFLYELEISWRQASDLAYLNDVRKLDFAQLARHIQENL